MIKRLSGPRVRDAFWIGGLLVFAFADVILVLYVLPRFGG